MASSAATTSAPPPPSLLTLPPTLLGMIFESLPPADLIRTLNLTSKHPVLARFAHSQGSEEGTLWTRLVRQYLSRFIPARAWFGLQENDKSTTPIGHFYKAAVTAANRRLEAALEEGLTRAEWTWELSAVSKPKFLFVPASVPSGKNQNDFLTLLEAFTCKECHRRGTATSQCVACGCLLCSDCATGCPKQDGCPFALCPACDRRYARTSLQHLESMFDPHSKPGLIEPSCSMCPDARGCEVHLPLGFIECTSCGEVRCPPHRCLPPGIGMCSCGRDPLCTRPACRPAGHYYRMCSKCYLQTCECCEEEWGEEEEEHSDEYGSSEEEGEDGVYDNGS
jgi:hypothetical protein